MDLKIDSTDKKILKILMQEARTSYMDIARKCGISGAAVHQRMNKIQKMGVIEGAHLQIKPVNLGYFTCAFIGLQVNILNSKSHDEVFEKIRKIPEVVESHHITGKYSLLLKVYTKNNEQLKSLIVEKLQSIPEIVSTETFISLQEGFERVLPIE
ncbi:MAG: Lrp/AsnC ligand binding domain-containing protein [Bacteroidales bacterium]|nr:Lrp/AsnC ligand binding domain-containing protein [Bacteroidales bacterium]